MNTLLSTFAQVTYTTTPLFEEETAAGAAVGAGIFTFGLLSIVIAYIIGALLLGQILKKPVSLLGQLGYRFITIGSCLKSVVNKAFGQYSVLYLL